MNKFGLNSWKIADLLLFSTEKILTRRLFCKHNLNSRLDHKVLKLDYSSMDRFKRFYSYKSDFNKKKKTTAFIETFVSYFFFIIARRIANILAYFLIYLMWSKLNLIFDSKWWAITWWRINKEETIANNVITLRVFLSKKK